MLTFSLANIKFSALLLILVLKINLGLSQFLNNTQVLAIVDDIRNLRFASAQDQILNGTQTNEMVAAIIHHVYSNRENNTNIIFDFAHEATPASLSFQILKSLKNEMTANNHSDPLQLVALYRAFEADVIFKRNNEPRLSPEMKIILNEIKADVKASAKQILKAAMFANSFEEDFYVRNVTNKLFNFYYEIDDEVMKELANETYPDVPAVQLAANIMVGSYYIPQQVTFLLALYELLELNNDLNNEAVLKIAYHFRIMKKLDTYKNMFTPKKYAVNEVIKRMPMCARNLYYADNLCIWNRGRSEYLYAANSQHNLSRRGIFTYGSGYITDEGIWLSEHYDDVYYFKSYAFQKEYLYASSSDKYDPITRHVLTWVDDGFVGDTCAWRIVLNGDFCYIQNVNFNEYLYTSDKILEERKRYVFTTKYGAIFDQPDFQWEIRNCG